MFGVAAGLARCSQPAISAAVGADSAALCLHRASSCVVLVCIASFRLICLHSHLDHSPFDRLSVAALSRSVEGTVGPAEGITSTSHIIHR